MKRFARSLITMSSLALAAAAMSPALWAQGGDSEATGSVADAVHRGTMKLFEEALAQVSLRPDQRAQLADLKSDFKSRHAPVHTAKKELLRALGDQVEAGNVDRCALEPQVMALADAVQNVNSADREALERFHDILDTDQRGQFVDALKQKWEEHKKAHTSGKWLDKAAGELNLTSEQRSKIETILKAEHEKSEAEPYYAATREGWKKMLDAFRGERFVLDDILPNKEQAPKVKRMAGAVIETVEAVVPLLTPEQRTLAANKLRMTKGDALPDQSE